MSDLRTEKGEAVNRSQLGASLYQGNVLKLSCSSCIGAGINDAFMHQHTLFNQAKKKKKKKISGARQTIQTVVFDFVFGFSVPNLLQTYAEGFLSHRSEVTAASCDRVTQGWFDFEKTLGFEISWNFFFWRL